MYLKCNNLMNTLQRCFDPIILLQLNVSQTYPLLRFLD